jgi:hypothetical protein
MRGYTEAIVDQVHLRGAGEVSDGVVTHWAYVATSVLGDDHDSITRILDEVREVHAVKVRAAEAQAVIDRLAHSLS